MKAVSRMMLAAAAASMTVLPVAAQAGTRAGDSGATYAVSAPGQGRAAQGEAQSGNIFGSTGFIVIFSTVAFVAGVLIFASTQDRPRTPGAR